MCVPLSLHRKESEIKNQNFCIDIFQTFQRIPSKIFYIKIMTTSDDFLTQVFATEKKAEEKIKKAEEKAKNDLVKARRKFMDDRATKQSNVREDFHKKLKEKQIEARGIYEKLLQDGEKEVSNLKKESNGQIEKALPVAQMFFLNEVL